jgi:hypothetical protein
MQVSQSKVLRNELEFCYLGTRQDIAWTRQLFPEETSSKHRAELGLFIFINEQRQEQRGAQQTHHTKRKNKNGGSLEKGILFVASRS